MPVPWTRIPDAHSLDPDPGCPFLGDGPTGNWSLAKGGQRDLPATLGQQSRRSPETAETASISREQLQFQANLNSSNRIRVLYHNKKQLVYHYYN
jgi:hypothetical protein